MTSDVQSPIVMDTSQFMEREEEFQPFDYHSLINADIEKVNTSEHVVDGVSLKEGCIGSYSKNFSTLCLDDDMSLESYELAEECVDEEQESYILKFAPDKE